LLVLAAADSAGIPAVGGVDALLITVAASSPRVAYIAAVLAIIGSLIGSSILFAIARKGGQVFLQKHINRGTGRMLHAWFERYGLVTVFVPAMSPLPMPMKIPVFCAGALEVSWSAFLTVVVLARAIRYFALAWLAQRFGHATLGYLKHHWASVLLIAISLAVAAIFGLRAWRRARPLAGMT
jgi:membrane protein YqaA with SNARE-associated domain